MTDIDIVYGPPPPDEEIIQIEDSTTATDSISVEEKPVK